MHKVRSELVNARKWVLNEKRCGVYTSSRFVNIEINSVGVTT